jgi:hypothetical protein
MNALEQLRREAVGSLTLESIVALLPQRARLLLLLEVNGFPFSNPTSVGIVRNGIRDSDDCFVIKVVWRCDLDVPRDPVAEVSLAVQMRDPTIDVEVADCDAGWVNEVLDVFRTLTIPAVVRHPFGLDGVTYRLTLNDLFGGLQLRWWSGGPKEWAGVTDHVRGIMRTIDSGRFPFTPGPLVFSYSVDLLWDSPGVKSQHLAAIRLMIPELGTRPVAELAKELSGSTRLHVGTFRRNDAILKCQLAAEHGLKAVMNRSKGADHV